jgi:hypothetical protein
MGDFDLFRTSDFHEELREAVRAVAEDLIAPHAADVDAESRFPEEGRKALVDTDFAAPHIPEEYGGVGADALATCIVIEEVARADVSASLIPAVNKLGSMPVILAGSDEVKQKYLPPLARGESTFSYGLSEREAGSDTAAMKCRARADGDDWVLNGQKSWITNAGESEYYTVLAVTDPDGARGNNVSAFVVEKSDAGFDFGEKERKLGIKGRRASCTSTTAASPATASSAPPVRGSRSRCAPSTTPASRSAPRPSVSRRVRSTTRWPMSRSASSSGSTSRSSRASSSCSPTWRWSSRPRATWSMSPPRSPSAMTPTCPSSERRPSASRATWR